jgi:O-antigen/teichoic acid export membrane protein
MSCLLLTTLLTAIAVFFWGGPIAAIVGIGQYQNWMLVLPAIVFITTFTIGANYWNIRNGEFRHLAQYRVTQSLAVAAAQGVAWRFSSGPAGLIVGGVLGLCAPAIVFLIGFWKKYRRLMRSISLGGMWQAARKFSNFPRYTVPWGFAAIARERGIILLLGMYATTDIVGLYTIALRLSYLPFQLIASSVSPIVYRRACEYSTVSAAAPMVYRVLKTIITYMTPASIIIGWFARDAFTVLMGHQWGKAGFYACLLAIPGSLQVLSVPLERLLDIASCQRVALIIETCYSLTVVSLTALVLASGKGVPIAIGLFAAVTAFYHVALLCAVYRFCCFPMRDLAMLAGRYIAFAGGTAFVLFLTTTNHPWVELMVSRK